MRLCFILAVILTAVTPAQAMRAWHHPLFRALRTVESSNRPKAVGDKGAAVGVYQLHRGYIKDVNRIYGTRFTPEDRWDPIKSHQIVRLYLAHYGRVYTRVTGKPVTCETLARIHNGGPKGWRKSATGSYWAKVQQEMKGGGR